MAEETERGISIIVPVGPDPEYLKYLPECLVSITSQMTPQDQVVVVSDMADLPPELFPVQKDKAFLIHKNLWLLGPADSWNVGVALAENEWCLLMGSDDQLMPNCLSRCRTEVGKDPLGYYNITCVHEGKKFDHFNNAAVVSKALWRETGGFPPSAGVGAPDALLISIMMKHMPKHLHQIARGTPLYWVRQHEAMETRKQTAVFAEEVGTIRNKETLRWKKPKWTK